MILKEEFKSSILKNPPKLWIQILRRTDNFVLIIKRMDSVSFDFTFIPRYHFYGLIYIIIILR